MGKMRHKTVKWVMQDHSTGNVQSWDLSQWVCRKCLSPNHLLPSWAWVSSPSALAGVSMLLWDLLESRQESCYMALRSAHHGYCSEFSSYVWNSIWVLQAPQCHPFPYNHCVLSSLLRVWSCSHGPPHTPLLPPLTFLMHTQHRFCTQAWNDTVAREAIPLGQSSV